MVRPKGMSWLLLAARYSALISLYCVSVSPLPFYEPWGTRLGLLILMAMLGVAYTSAMLRGTSALFSLASGTTVVLACVLLVASSDAHFILSWAALGVGLTAILVGLQYRRSAELLGPPRTTREEEAAFLRAARAGFLRILVFMGLVMLCSLLLLLFSLNLALGGLPIWAMAALALLAMVGLGILAINRHPVP
jgi:hypothetical protein